jgi:hypothetical protein
MVKVNQFIALAAVFALSFFAAQATFAGPGGSAGDTFTVAGGFDGAETGNTWATDPLGAGGQMNEYTYQYFGPVDADYRFCAQWEEGGVVVPVAVKEFQGTFIWWSKYAGSATSHRFFGNNAFDTPTVMDTDGDGIDEIVVVRDVPLTEGTARQWLVRNDVDETESSTVDQFLFGPGGSDPVPGNWDGIVENGDEPAVTRTGTSGNKLWTWQDSQNCVGTTTACNQMKGSPGDTNVAYTSNGRTRPGVGQVSGGTNAVRVETAEGAQVVLIGPESAPPVGHCNL